MNSQVILSTIVRISDSKYLWQLEEALFSLANILGIQGRREAVVVTQGLSVAAKSSVMQIRKFLLSENFQIKIIHTDFPSGVDEREKLLNIGVEKSRGRFLCFLDYDDLIYPEAYAALSARLRESNAGIVFGKVRVARAERRDKFSYLSRYEYPFDRERTIFELWRDNFCPIHSFLIDTKIIKKNLIHFEHGLKRAEDYALLLKLTARFGAVFCEHLVGEYQYRDDGTNTVQTTSIESNKKLSEWVKAKERIDRIKQELKPEISLHDIEVQMRSTAEAKLLISRLERKLEGFEEKSKNFDRLTEKSKILSAYLRMLGGVSRLYDKNCSARFLPKYSVDDIVSTREGFRIGTQIRLWASPTKDDAEFGNYWVILKSVFEGVVKIQFSTPNIDRLDVARHFGLNRKTVATVVDFDFELNPISLEIFLLNESGVLIKSEAH